MSMNEREGHQSRERYFAPIPALKLAAGRFPTTLMDELWEATAMRVIVWNNYHDADSATIATILRHRAALEASESYTATWTHGGTPPSADAFYQQELALFSFFVNGHSCIESLGFLFNALASQISSNVFRMTTPADYRAISMHNVAKRFQRCFGDEALTAELVALDNSATWKQWCKTRNDLVHRTTPRRTTEIVALGPGEVPETFGDLYFVPGNPVEGEPARDAFIRAKVDQWGRLELTQKLTIELLDWLESQLQKILSEAVTFFTSQAESILASRQAENQAHFQRYRSRRGSSQD